MNLRIALQQKEKRSLRSVNLTAPGSWALSCISHLFLSSPFLPLFSLRLPTLNEGIQGCLNFGCSSHHVHSISPFKCPPCLSPTLLLLCQIGGCLLTTAEVNIIFQSYGQTVWPGLSDLPILIRLGLMSLQLLFFFGLRFIGNKCKRFK